ncbi:MAG: helicase-related protein [Candidatus Anstonellales archaeon]
MYVKYYRLGDKLVKIESTKRLENSLIQINYSCLLSGETGMINVLESELNNIFSKDNEYTPKFNYENFDIKRFAYRTLLLKHLLLNASIKDFEHILAEVISGIDFQFLPHQLDIFYCQDKLFKYYPIRLLIADDVGAGKTIITGLLIRELRRKGYLSDRVLIITPSNLKQQWQRELQEKFLERYQVVDRSNIININQNKIIISMDLAKSEDVKKQLLNNKYDLIVIDEAHRVGISNINNKTERFELAKQLAENTKHLILLTATPHNGKKESFRSLLYLLFKKYINYRFESYSASLDNVNRMDYINFYIRRLKSDFIDWNGNKLYTNRDIKLINFNLSADESDIYNKILEYIRKRYNNIQDPNKRKGIGYVLLTYQKRFSSSSLALIESLKRRKHLRSEKYNEEDFEDFFEDEIATDTYQDWENEIIEDMLEMLNRIEKDSKFEELNKRVLQKHSNDKLIIFTEYIDTVKYLNQKLEKLGYRVVKYTGDMSLKERIEAIEQFKTSVNIMIATDAMSEGLNLQFCNIIVNYDLPWNPNVIEQRVGRVYRIGQKNNVTVYNLISNNTIDNKILSILLRKLIDIKNTLGDYNIDNILGSLPSDIINRLYREVYIPAILESYSEYEYKIDEILDTIKTQYYNNKEFVDIVSKTENVVLDVECLKKLRYMNGLNIQDLNIQAYYELAKKIKPRNEQAHEENSEDEYLTYDELEKDEVKYLKYLLDGLVIIHRKFENGYIFFYELISSTSNHEQTEDMGIKKKLLIPIFVSNRGVVKILDHQEIIELLSNRFDNQRLKNYNSIFNHIKKNFHVAFYIANQEMTKIPNKYLTELKEEVSIIKDKFSRLIRDIEKLTLSIKQNIKEGINTTNIFQYKIRFLGVVYVISSEDDVEFNLGEYTDPSDPKNVEEVERIAMEIAIQHEQEQGRFPKDVSKQNLGYDIVSKDANGNYRYIEVKGLFSSSKIQITENEYNQSKRLGENYYLYVIDTGSKTLYEIRDPSKIENIWPETVMEPRTKYILPFEYLTNMDPKNIFKY